MPATAIRGTFVAIGPPAVRVVAAAVFWTNNNLIPWGKRILAHDTFVAQKWGLFGNSNGGKHRRGDWGLEINLYESPVSVLADSNLI